MPDVFTFTGHFWHSLYFVWTQKYQSHHYTQMSPFPLDAIMEFRFGTDSCRKFYLEVSESHRMDKHIWLHGVHVGSLLGFTAIHVFLTTTESICE